MNKNFLSMNDKELDSFVLNEFSYMTRDKQSEVLKDEGFIRALFSSFGFAFCHLTYLYEDDYSLLEETFSKRNSQIIKELDRNLVIDNFMLFNRNAKSCEYILSSENLEFLHNEYPLIIHFLEFDDISAKTHYDFFNKNLNNEHLSKMYTYLKLDKITAKELELLVNIKGKLSNPDKFYSTLNKDSVYKLLDQGFISLFTEEDIKYLAHNFYLGRYSSLPTHVLKNRNFVNQLTLRAIKGQSSNELLTILNDIENNNPQISYVYRKIFHEIIDKKENKTIEDLSFRFFNDKDDNLLMNAEVILNYCNSNPKYREMIHDDFYSLYSYLLSANKYNVDDLYNKMLNSNEDYSSVLYKHMDLARKMFFDDLNSSLTNLNQISQVVDNVQVHVYDQEDFSFVVHATYAKEGEYNQYAEKINKKLNPKNIDNLPYLSASYINQNNISVFSKEGIIYGFNNLKNMTMVHAACQDSYSVNNGRESSIVTHAPTYLNLEEFSNQSTYSEILFKPTIIKPDFIVCYDTIDEYDIAVAKKLGIDIVLIDSIKYKNTNDNKIDKDVISKRYK